MAGDGACVAIMVGGGLFLAGSAAYLTGLWEYRLRKIIQYTPTAKAIGVAPGIAEVAGKAKAVQLFESPYAHKECAYYKTEIYKWHGGGKHRRKDLHRTLQSREPIYIEDDTGLVLVRPQNRGKGKFVFGVDEKLAGQPVPGFFGKLIGGKENAPLKKFLQEHCPELANYADDIEVYETYVCEGDGIYAIGTAKEAGQSAETIIEKMARAAYEKPGIPVKLSMSSGLPDVDDEPVAQDAKKYAAAIEIAPSEKNNGLFLICDGDEKSALSSVGLVTYGKMLLGPVAASIGFVILSSMLMLNGLLVAFWIALAVLGTLAMYAYVAFMEITEVYNGMIVLRSNIERAKANVGVLLKRRSDLLPQLAEVVKAAAKQEKSVQEGIAMLRAARIGEGNKALIALLEDYPKLKSSENFLLLQKQLEKTEEWIAASRGFAAESIMLYNAKIQSFPQMLFAGVTGLKVISPQDALE